MGTDERRTGPSTDAGAVAANAASRPSLSPISGSRRPPTAYHPATSATDAHRLRRSPSPMGSWGPPPAAPKPGVIPLRPLGIPELLDGAITAIRRYPKATLVPSFLVALGLGAVNFLTVLVSLTMYRGIEDLDPNTVTGSDLAGIFGPTVFVALVGGLVQFVATVLLTGIITAVMGQAVLGNPITLAEAWEIVRPRAWRLLGLGLLVGLIVGLGLLFCLIPGVILGGLPVALLGRTRARAVDRR